MKPCAWTAEALQALGAGRSPYGPLASVAEIMPGAHLYDYRHGASRALVAVRPVVFDKGTRLNIVGLRSLGERLQQTHFYASLDALALAYGAQLIGCSTQVPHVAKCCVKNGYEITGAILTKNMEEQNNG